MPFVTWHVSKVPGPNPTQLGDFFVMSSRYFVMLQLTKSDLDSFVPFCHPFRQIWQINALFEPPHRPPGKEETTATSKKSAPMWMTLHQHSPICSQQKNIAAWKEKTPQTTADPFASSAPWTASVRFGAPNRCNVPPGERAWVKGRQRGAQWNMFVPPARHGNGQIPCLFKGTAPFTSIYTCWIFSLWGWTLSWFSGHHHSPTELKLPSTNRQVSRPLVAYIPCQEPNCNLYQLNNWFVLAICMGL